MKTAKSDLKLLFPVSIQCNLCGGATIDSSLKEAVILAIEQDMIVEFSHNASSFRIDPRSIIKYAFDAFEIKK